MTVTLARPSPRHEPAFLAAVERSRRLHGAWVSPPRTPEEYQFYVTRARRATMLAWLVWTDTRELAGAVNVSEIVRGNFQSAYLGYYAFAPHARHGYMRAALGRVLRHAFLDEGLHRLEANIQPANRPSIALVESLGFLKEGFSPRYLKIGGRWRDHERWAITVEDWMEK